MSLSISNDGFSVRLGEFEVKLGANLKDGIPALEAKVDVAGTELKGNIDLTGHTTLSGKTKLDSNEYNASVGYGGLRGTEFSISVDDEDDSNGFKIKASRDCLEVDVRKKMGDDTFSWSAAGNRSGDVASHSSYRSSDGSKDYAAGFKKHHKDGYALTASGRHMSGKDEYSGGFSTDSSGNQEVGGSYRTSDGKHNYACRGRKSRDGHFSSNVLANHRSRGREIGAELDTDSKGSSQLRCHYENQDRSERYAIEGQQKKGHYSWKASGFRKSNTHLPSQVSLEVNSDREFRSSFSTSAGSFRGRGGRHRHHQSIQHNDKSDEHRGSERTNHYSDYHNRHRRDGPSSEDGASYHRDTSDGGSGRYQNSSQRHRDSNHRPQSSYKQTRGSHPHSRDSYRQPQEHDHQSHGSHHQTRGSKHQSRDSYH